MSSAGDVSFGKAFRSLVGCLRRYRIRYCLIGALAVSAWGTSRATQDIDCLVVLEEKQRARFLEELRRRGFIHDVQWADLNPLLKDHCLRFRLGGIPVDLLFPRDAHDTQALKQRRLKHVVGQKIWVVGPEDLILMKLKASRHRDFDDVLSVVSEQGEALDQGYLKQWAKRLGLWEGLMYCLMQAQAPDL